MINHFTFNGTSTAQLGLIVSGVSIFGAGSRKVEKAGIPGRNGDLQIELGGFNNYTVRYTVSITKNFTTTAQQIREWLLESKGYCDLTDTYHPDEIRKACFNSDIEFTTSMLYKYGQASIQFDCLPERYLTTNTPITTTATADTTTDTTMSLNTVPTPLNISLNGNTTQEGTPTPSTPQAIHNVSGDNEIKVVGKNLQPNECTPSTYIGITTENSGEMIHYFGTASGSGGRTAHKMKHVILSRGAYSFSAHNISTNGTINLPDMVVQKVVGTTYTTIISRGLATGGSFSLTEETEISIGFNCTNGTTYNCYFNIQLENGTTQTTYEPYTGQSYPLNLGSIELNKIGTYQDYIYKNGGKWYVHKETGKVDLGTLTWSYYSTSPTFMYNATLPVVSGTSSALCDAYPCGLSTDNKTFRFNGQILRIYDPDYSDASAFKTAMNGVMLYYPLATPTNTEITDTTLINQLNNIEKAYSYNGTTNILQVSNDNGFMLGVVSLHGSTFTSNYKGEPIITVNSTGLIYLNGEVMEVLSAPVTINCQTMQCYNGVVNMNNEVRVNDFPEIKIGENTVGSSMALTITPNNWRH